MPDIKKVLRFAALVRVSTESQEKHGESLRTQRTQNERDITRMGGKVVEWYGGQEHATPGWERKELDRLIADAGKGKFDAVMVAYADRWSRDNIKSEEGLEAFRNAGVRFFVSTMEMNLFDPQHCFILSMNAVVGQFIARQQSKKSIENRIERAQRGIPCVGKLPFGRTYDEKSGWAVIPEKKQMVEEVAKRLVARTGTLNTLASEYGMGISTLSRILRFHCGPEWQQEFRIDKFNIHEVVPTPVPPLLPDATIAAVRKALVSNRTRAYGGRPRHNYLLSGCIYCATCGTALTGTYVKQNQRRYYRHNRSERAKSCSASSLYVPAAEIESAVIADLFKTFGNPAAIERSIRAAIPDCAAKEKERGRLQGELDKIAKQRAKLVDALLNETFTEAEVRDKRKSLNEREAELTARLNAVEAELADVPNPQTIQCYVEEIESAMGKAIFVFDDEGNTYAGGNDVQSFLMMSDEDRRVLVESALLGESGGKRSGVYVTRTGRGRPGPGHPTPYRYDIRGRLPVRVSGTVLPLQLPAASR